MNDRPQVALITGGARNIGLEIARGLGTQGLSIVIADICGDLATIPYSMSSSSDLARSVDTLSSLGIDTMGEQCDIRVEKQVEGLVQKILNRFGRIDILVNNAGVISLSPIQSITEEAWNEVLDVCLRGTFFCCKHVIPHMIDKHFGKIVNIASLAGHRGIGCAVHYCAAKHGVIGLTKSLAIEVADHNINVNAVCPGTTQSEMLAGLASQIDLEDDPYTHFSRDHLLQDRQIEPSDIANAVLWLVSEKSRCITGTTIHVDAGWSAR